MSITEEMMKTYDIKERLGSGSGGVVYRAYHKRLKQDVVLKQIIRKNVASSSNRREVDILKNLHHSYLPQVIDYWEEAGEVYTVMSYIPGQSFSQLLKQRARFELKHLIIWGMKICSALHYLHSQKPPVIHSDIKPANIMLKPDGNICLIDFNISFYLDGSTILGYSKGYTSPEQFILTLDSKSREKIGKYQKVDERADIYSVGATFYHLATGKKMPDFQHQMDKELLIQCTNEAFAEIIEKATKVNPHERFQSAQEMFYAFQNISKKDKRYQALLKKQLAIRMALIGMVTGCLISGGYGIRLMNIEKVEKYNALVKTQIDLQKAENYHKQEEVYREAIQVLPNRLESYYQNACALYKQRKYKECIAFIEYDICENERIDFKDSRIADIFYLKADSFFKLGEYDEAVDAYQVVFEVGTSEPEYYRDYAIALAYVDEEEHAKDVLEQAIKYGLKEDSIYYAKGEIEKEIGELNQALQEFEKCIVKTDQEDMKSRAYVMMSDIYAEKNEMLKQKEILEMASKELPLEKQIYILERLVKVNIELAEKTENHQYRKEAITYLKQMIEQGFATASSYDILAVLYEKEGELSEARETLETMRDKFGESYKVYMRFAFLEIDEQQLKSNEKRNYTKFEQYYDRAKKMYEEENANQNVDQEMQFLDNLYSQVLEGGWI